MNVTCESCQRRYVVPDDKLGDQPVLRMRCRNCQHVIEVAIPPPPPASPPVANPWDDEPTRAAPALDARAQWFAMVKGQQMGPLELPALEAKVRRGEIGLSTFLWRDGMPEWRKAEELPELLPVFAAPKTSAPTQPPPTPAGPSAALKNLFDDEERTVLRSKPKVARPKPDPQPESPQTGSVEVELAEDEGPEEAEPAGRRGRWRWVVLTVLGLAAVGGMAAVLAAR